MLTNRYTAGKRLLLTAVLYSMASCNPGWDSESRSLFREGCLEDAKERGMETTAAISMCECRLETAMRKYPKLSDALRNIDSLVNDPEMKACQ